MIKYLIVLSALVFAACGAAQDDDTVEVGSTEQALTAASSANFGFGVANASLHNACVTNNLSQDCLIPTSKFLPWCIADSAMTAAQISAAQAAIGAAVSGTGFSAPQVAIGDVAGCNADLNNHSAKIGVNLLTCSGACTNSSSIEGCVCASPTVGAPLTESLSGTYRGLEGGFIHIDQPDLDANFGTGSAGQGVREHGIAHAFAVMMGAGNKTNFSCAGSSPITSKCTTPTSFSSHNFYTAGELCKLSTFVQSSPTTFAYSGTCGD